MLTLMQVISRMYYLEYTEYEIREYLTNVAAGVETVETLFDTLDYELPHPAMLKRFTEKLNDPNSLESAIKIGILKAGG